MTVFYILIGLASILLILIVLVQNPKGGGLASTFAASNQIMGVKKTNDFLEKSTWTLAIVVTIFCIVSTLASSSKNEVVQSDLENRILNEAPAAMQQNGGTVENSAESGNQQTETPAGK